MFVYVWTRVTMFGYDSLPASKRAPSDELAVSSCRCGMQGGVAIDHKVASSSRGLARAQHTDLCGGGGGGGGVTAAAYSVLGKSVSL